MHTNPNDAKLITSDINNFWEAFDSDLETRVAFQKFYFNGASIGLNEFIKLRIESLDALVDTIHAHHSFYGSIRQPTLQINQFKSSIRSSFHNLKSILPEAIFPDTYFLIGRMNSGGTLSDKGLFIGTEIFCGNQNTMTDTLSAWNKEVLQPIEVLPHIIAHELVHYQQWMLAHENPEKIINHLLGHTIVEGAADFIGELISGRHINERIYTYGYKNEQALWQEFQQVMHGEELKDWLYGGQSGERPSDLGYFIGYRIIKSYYAKARDKAQAVKNILTITNFDDFLVESGYGQKE
jgi:Predicted Zn-dependent protease (DUF2268)